MRRNVKLFGAATTIGAAGLLGLASAGWACSADAHLNSLAEATAEPGQVVTVTGGQFVGVTELHWATVSGPVLATVANGGQITQDVTIPQAQNGFYTIVGVAHRADGTIIGQGATSIEVVAPPNRPVTNPPPAVNPPAVNPPAVNPPAVNRPPAVNPPVVNPPPAVNPPVVNPPVVNPPPAVNPSAGVNAPSAVPPSPVVVPASGVTGPVANPPAGPSAAVPGAVGVPSGSALPAVSDPGSQAEAAAPAGDASPLASAEAAKVDPWIPTPTPGPGPAAVTRRPASLLDTGSHPAGGPVHLGLILLGLGVPGLLAAAAALEVRRTASRAKAGRS